MIETVLVIGLLAYLLLFRNHSVGADLSITVLGAGLMALVSYWTLHTVRDALQLLVVRHSRLG
ncbi:MAG: hypothetical protein R3276_11765 [Marinobacter sp.]|nr:hypothetical protein [Marinobacter sp.]